MDPMFQPDPNKKIPMRGKLTGTEHEKRKEILYKSF